MDFQQIGNMVEKYLEKQQSSMLANPHRINLTIKKLEQYTSIFHNDLKDRLQLEQREPNPGIELAVRKPAFSEVQTEQSYDPSRIRYKLFKVSDQLINEYRKLHSYQNQWIPRDKAISTFKSNIIDIYTREIDFPNRQGTLLDRIKDDINRCLALELYDKELERLFSEIYSENVIRELEEMSVPKSPQIISRIIKEYREYFSACLNKYERYCKEKPSDSELLPLNPEQMPQPEQLSKLEQLPTETAPAIAGTLDDFFALQESAYLEQRQKREQAEKDIEAITVEFKDGNKKTLTFNLLPLEMQTVLIEALKKE
ncbi:hypothetical protein [Paenibacillus sp. PL91]|uniref:hypothetical protein n=1 Tax=Paenibacillus sp. PL91 TaxID=2729538 RepID=UPI00145D9C3E|nr:hypothetical protein [Paenibacillus sp. PL91]MBC9203663.1 hypothetical protein [Paenibacillus sp. PL91]